ncbi:Gfo/Idh/MocA family protein [Paenibacillus solisilvae]|uniref:Gfo/Idh/MocA family protein n=1 Tax=Paenibacillus solisilvae TaxID=2486751 RepID=A0ABW0VY61_9BACL
MEPIRIGIIGVGQIGKSHLKQYASLPGANVVAIADVNEKELQFVSESYQVPHSYTNFHDLLKRDDIEAVDICLHNNFHAPVTIRALEAGKHVYCEKPIAGSYADGLAMMNAAKVCDKKLHIQLATLYSKETKAAKHLIDQGKLGKLYHARSNGFRRRSRPYVDGYGSMSFVQKEISAGGALNDMGVYHIAQVLYLLGLPEVERISGKIYQETEMSEERKRKSGYNVEELGMGFIKLSGGMTLDLIEAWAAHLNALEGSMVMGSSGGLKLAPFSYHANLCDIEMNATFDLNAMDYRWHQLRDDEDAYDSSQAHWIAALQGRVDLLPSAQLALQAMLICEGIYLSDRTGHEVSIDEVVYASQSSAVVL